jgi:hypothetical protein
MSQLTHIAVGKDGAVWGASKTDGALFYRKGGLGDAWIPNKDGKADVVAVVSENHVWCVNKDHQIWHLENGKWNQVPTHSGKTDARTISVGAADGTVWYADNNDGTLFRREGNRWIPDKDGKADVVAAVSKDQVWCVNKDHQIWRLENGKWTQVPTHSGKADASTLSVGADGTVWYGNAEERLFRREGNAWHQDPDAGATVVAVGSKDQVWCVNKEGDAFQRTSQGTWQKVDRPKGSWEYKVQQNDGLYAIVRQQFNLTDEKEVQRIAGLIAAENHIKNKDRIDAGTVLKLQSY